MLTESTRLPMDHSSINKCRVKYKEENYFMNGALPPSTPAI